MKFGQISGGSQELSIDDLIIQLFACLVILVCSVSKLCTSISLSDIYVSGLNNKAQQFLHQFRFLLKFTGKDEEINLLGDGTESAEFGQWSWMSPQEILDRVCFHPGLENDEYLFAFLSHLKLML